MSTILFHNTMEITEGHLDQFRAAVRRAVEFVEEASVLAHWAMSDPYIQDVMAHCTVRSFETYGEMSEEVLDGLRSGLAGNADVRPWLTGFTHFS